MPSVGFLETKQAYNDAIGEKSTLIVMHIFSNNDRKNGPLEAGLERAANDYSSLKFYRLNKDQVPEITKEIDLLGTPIIVFFKDGAKIDNVLGENLDEIRSAVEHHSGSTKW